MDIRSYNITFAVQLVTKTKTNKKVNLTRPYTIELVPPQSKDRQVASKEKYAQFRRIGYFFNCPGVPLG